MSNPTTFMNNYVTAIQNIVDAIEALVPLNAQIAGNSTLTSSATGGYFSTSVSNPRTDITPFDAAAAYTATQAMVTAFNTSPTAAALFKMTQP